VISGADKRPPPSQPAANDDAFDISAADGGTSQRAKILIVDPLGEPGLAGQRERYNLPANDPEFPDADPYSPLYGRTNMDETPETIHHFWFEHTAERPAAMGERMKFWFGGSFDTDRIIAQRFFDILAKLSAGEAWRWAERGMKERLAAVIVLDQFSRNIFRGSPAAFENDALARALVMEAIASGEDRKLAPVERMFFYLPLEHSEALADQKLSVAKFEELLGDAPDEARKAFESALDYAKKHEVIIARFGRFPHRNKTVGRESTAEETEFLKTPGSSF
jgi:uncharacterized protein (DUF924 family)